MSATTGCVRIGVFAMFAFLCAGFTYFWASSHDAFDLAAAVFFGLYAIDTSSLHV